MGFFRDLIEVLSSETTNPSIWQHKELDRHREEIQRITGSEHGLIEAVKGQPHTYEVNGVRVRIADGRVEEA